MERIPWEILKKHYSNSSSDNDRELLNSWIEENEEHRLLFDEISEIVNIGVSFPGDFNEDTAKAWNEIQRKLEDKGYISKPAVIEYSESNAASMKKSGNKLEYKGESMLEYKGEDKQYKGEDRIADRNDYKQSLGNDGSREGKGYIKMPRARFYKYAAAVIIPLFLTAALFGYFFDKMVTSDKPVKYTVVYSHGGQKTEVTLPDSTKVWLNANTVLKYPSNFDKQHRSVLLDGEAFFEVSHDPENLFVVNTVTALKINVHGTSFNVKAYASEDVIETTLVNGKISIQGLVIKGRESEEIVMKPNQTFKYYKSSSELAINNLKDKTDVNVKRMDNVKKVATVELIPKVDVSPITAWKEGRLVFHDESFESLSSKLERWYNVDIHFADSTIKKIHFTGTFEKENINQVLNYMQITTPMEYSMKLNDITIRYRER